MQRGYEDKITIKSSPYHGLGVFAATSIARRTVLLDFAADSLLTCHRNGEMKTLITKVRDEYPEFALHAEGTYGSLDAGLRKCTFGVSGERSGALEAFVWPACYLQHSCLPNLGTIQTADGVFFVANRDIDIDEELSISYIDETLPREQRISKLKARYDFECRCVRCDNRGGLKFDVIAFNNIARVHSWAKSFNFIVSN